MKQLPRSDELVQEIYKPVTCVHAESNVDVTGEWTDIAELELDDPVVKQVEEERKLEVYEVSTTFLKYKNHFWSGC